LRRARARLAADYPFVRDFRERVLEHRLLSRAEARAFLFSLAAQRLPLGDYLRVRAGGGDMNDPKTSPRPHGGKAEMRLLFWGRVPLAELRPGLSRAIHSGLVPRGQHTAGPVEVYLGSVLDMLWKAADWTAGHYGWGVAEASWFILTGRRPSVRVVQTALTIDRRDAPRDHVRQPITLTAEPWVSAATVARSFSEAQRAMLGHRSGRMNARRLRIFEFVESEIARRARLPNPGDWQRELYPSWCKRAKERERVDAWKLFRRDYTQTKRELLFPEYAVSRFPEPIAAIKARLERQGLEFRDYRFVRRKGKKPGRKSRGARRLES
jgi:hypothetical protein